LFECVCKFIDKAHFDVSSRGIRVRSIDPHDFCYVDLFLRKSFFKQYQPKLNLSFAIDVSKFSKFLPHLASADLISMNVYEGFFELEAIKKWKMVFRVGFLEEDPYNLPEPKKISYEASAEIPAKEFSEMVRAASTISNELIFSIHENIFTVSSKFKDYYFSAEPSKVERINDIGNRMVSCSLIANYVNTLSGLIKKCETVRVWLGDGKPIRLDLIYQNKGTFSFTLSHKRIQTRPKRVAGRSGDSLPRLTVTKLPDFLLYLSSCPEGEETRFLVDAGLETSGGDYTRMAKRLDLVYRRKGRIKLTRKGEIFVNLVQNNLKQSKEFLHALASSKIKAYKLMMESLKQKPLAPEELYEEVNRRLGEEKLHKIDKQDLSTLLGLAIWCGVVDRKLALYYFGAKKVT
jgi:hypothetical protein